MRPVVDPAPVRTGRIRTLVRLEFVGQTMPVARKLSDHTLYHVLAQSRLAAQLMRSSISSEDLDGATTPTRTLLI